MASHHKGLLEKAARVLGAQELEAARPAVRRQQESRQTRERGHQTVAPRFRRAMLRRPEAA